MHRILNRSTHKVLLTTIVLGLFALAGFGQDWEVWPNGATDLATGKHYPSANAGPLKSAILHSRPGDVIEVHGRVAGGTIGTDNTPGRNDVYRADPVDVTIVGTPESSIGPLAWGGRKKPGGLPGFAVEGLHLVDLVVDGRKAQSPLHGFMGTQYGDISYTRVRLLSTKSKTKWGSRINGHARTITMVGCIFIGGGIEHAAYFDNTTGLPLVGDTSILVEGNVMQGWGRTALQVVTREHPTSAAYTNPGPGLGNLLVYNNTSTNNGWEGGNGGTAFTVAAWPQGVVRFQGNHSESPWDNGCIVAWGDKAKLGAMVLPGGYVFSHVVIKENTAYHPKASRDMVAVESALLLQLKFGEVGKLSLVSGNRGFNLAHRGGKSGTTEILTRGNPNLLTGVQCPQPWMLNKQAFNPAIFWVDPTGGGRPPVDPVTEPGREPATEPVRDPVREPATEPVRDPVREPAPGRDG